MVMVAGGVPLLHDGAGNGDAAALVTVALDALGLARAVAGRLVDDALDGGRGGAAGAVAVDERRVGRSAGHGDGSLVGMGWDGGLLTAKLLVSLVGMLQGRVCSSVADDVPVKVRYSV